MFMADAMDEDDGAKEDEAKMDALKACFLVAWALTHLFIVGAFVKSRRLKSKGILPRSECKGTFADFGPPTLNGKRSQQHESNSTPRKLIRPQSGLVLGHT